MLCGVEFIRLHTTFFLMAFRDSALDVHCRSCRVIEVAWVWVIYCSGLFVSKYFSNGWGNVALGIFASSWFAV